MMRSPQETVDWWNEHMPLGTSVILVNDFGAEYLTVTRSEAWLLGDNTPVVKVVGRLGGYSLMRIRPAT